MRTGQLLLDRAIWVIGWMSLEELSFLAEIASELRDGSIVYEIGSLCGRSTRAIADNSPEDCKIYCVDPWNFKVFTEDNKYIQINRNTYNQFCINLYDHIASNKVIPTMMKWENFIPLQKADLIFIDGNHEYEAAKYDIKKAFNYTKRDGIIAGHDYNFETVNLAIKEALPNNEIHVRETIWWTRKF